MRQGFLRRVALITGGVVNRHSRVEIGAEVQGASVAEILQASSALNHHTSAGYLFLHTTILTLRIRIAVSAA